MTSFRRLRENVSRHRLQGGSGPPPKPIASSVAGRKERIAEILRFGLAGGVNTFFGFVVFAALVQLDVNRPITLLIAMSAGVAFNFITYGGYAFRRLESRRLPRFLVVYGLLYVLNLGLLELLHGVTGLGEVAAQLICLTVVAPTAYLALRSQVFAGGQRGQRDAS